jgi:outer membrane protein OmpA-like peptidoglycan-associated protein
MIPAQFPRRRLRGNVLVPVLLIVGALAVSALIFFFFTRPHMEQNREQKEVATAPSTAPASPGATTPATTAPAKPDGTTPGAPSTTASAKPAPTSPTPPPAVATYGPEEIAKDFAFLLAKNDLASAAKTLAGDDPSQMAAVQAMLHKIFRELGYKPSAPGQPQVIGLDGTSLRLAIPLVSSKPGMPAARLMLDLDRDDKGAWKVGKIHLPKELEAALAALPESPIKGAPGKPFIVVDQAPDALVMASDFVNDLLKLDLQSARKRVEMEKVSPVKLAAICMVFEDGKYRLADTKPLVATVSSESSSWVITRVRSDLLQQQTEFGLEMEKVGADWRVSGVNLSKLLSDSARPSTIEGVPYTPLVQSPKGGDSIALYFEYDQATLHPRAQRQLDIIASLLKASPNKKLTIGGFTDAKGSDQYNISLSEHRADAVRDYLLSRGVPVSQLATTGFGKSLPLSPNVNPDGTDNPEGRSHNRRAEILLDF